MTSTLELYRRIGNATAKEKRKSIEETEQELNHYNCKVYTADGKEFTATSVRPVRNQVGYGYRVETEINGHKAVMFYKASEVVGIIPIIREETK